MEVEALVPEIARLLDDTLGPEERLISSATEGLVRLSGTPGFASALIAVATGARKLASQILQILWQHSDHHL